MNSTIWNPTFFAHSIEEAKAIIRVATKNTVDKNPDILINGTDTRYVDWDDYKDEPVLHVEVYAEFEISALQVIVDEVNDLTDKK